MIEKMGVGKKIGFGFGIILILLAVAAAWSVLSLQKIYTDTEYSVRGNTLRGSILQREVDHLNWAKNLNSFVTDVNSTELNVQTDPHKCAFGKWYYSEERKHAEELFPDVKQPLSDIEDFHSKLHRSAVEIKEVYKKADPELPRMITQMQADHLTWANHLMAFFLQKKDKLEVETDHQKCSLGNFLYGDAGKVAAKSDPELAKLLEAIKAPHERLHSSASKIQQLWNKKDPSSINKAQEIFKSQTSPALEETQTCLANIGDCAYEMVEGRNKMVKIYSSVTAPNLEKVQALLKGITETVEKEVASSNENLVSIVKNTKSLILILGAATAILGLLLAFFLTKSLTTSLRKAINELWEGATQITSASKQVSAASQSLAQGAATQASSLEETSSAIEELAGMTRKNADNTNHAGSLASSVSSAIEKGTISMEKMAEAIREIKRSSVETAKIIKVIDEIAFQTNLLALNAAVEAARAGEAGKGFAVVAEEVRNLAIRSAEAAKNTNYLIENSQRNSDNGVRTTEEFTSILSEVTLNIRKLNELVGQISAASNEQAQGIAQINVAMVEIDKVIQSNAAGAEETASASEQLAAQAHQQQDTVGELITIVEGKKTSARSASQFDTKPKAMKSDNKRSNRRVNHNHNSIQEKNRNAQERVVSTAN